MGLSFLRRQHFSGEGDVLRCPACKNAKVKFLENIGCGQEQWRCQMKECGLYFRYLPKPMPLDMSRNDFKRQSLRTMGDRNQPSVSQQRAIHDLTKGVK